MTEADALDRARALLQEPAERRGSAWAAVGAALLLAAMAAGFTGLTVLSPSTSESSAARH